MGNRLCAFAGNSNSRTGGTRPERRNAMSLLAPIEEKLEQIWAEVTGEAREEDEQALADVRAEVAKVEPLLSSFKTDVEAAVEAAEPAVKTARRGARCEASGGCRRDLRRAHVTCFR